MTGHLNDAVRMLGDPSYAKAYNDSRSLAAITSHAIVERDVGAWVSELLDHLPQRSVE